MDEADKLFQLRASLVGAAGQVLWDAGKQSTVGRIVALLKARFGSENQAERFRAELRSPKRTKGEPLQKLYQDVRRLMSLAYPSESSVLLNIVGCDVFLEALDYQAMRVRILEKRRKMWTTLSTWLAVLSHSTSWALPDRKRRRANRDLHVPRPAARNPPVQREQRYGKRS